MKFKLDENLGLRAVRALTDAGHDVQTVRDEQLNGRPDEVIYDVCRLEGRCLVTLDLDFSNVLRFSPKQTAGIVVLRPGSTASLPMLTILVQAFVAEVANRQIAGQVWIVEPGRIRVHQFLEDEA